ncbi:MAG: glycohydrolase toxin TNT-related protein [Mycobacterium kyogaense]|uniref:TNT domain-containing protein n=1 Tax=Mycobacterium kyogaense TaxID=2212479 RepID=UPI002FFA5BC7
MTAPITVDPVTLSGTGAAVATDGVTVATAVHSLSTALLGAGALFGHDAAGLLFGQTYTEAGTSLLDAAASAVNACRKVGFGVQMSAFNYEHANAASTVGGGETSVPQPSAPGGFTAPSMPPPMGSGVVAPLAWTVVESLVGDVWPDGNPEEMRAAAAAWRSFGTAVGGVAEPVAAAGAALAGQQIPEAGHMSDAAGQISSGLTDIAAQASELAAGVEAFAANVEATQNAIRALLHQLSISGVLDALGDIFSGENPWQKVQEVADEIKTVLANMKRQADASRTLFSQSMNALDSATTSLQGWATKEFVEAFGEDVGTALSQDFKALTDLPAGGLKFVGVTAEGIQGLDPMRFAYDPQGALDTWKGLADSTAMVTNPALLAEKVVSDPQGSLNAAEGLLDWEDVENGHPFRALGYNAAQVGSMFLPGAGEAGPAAGAASAEARVAGAEARAAGAGTRDAAAAAGGRAASATEGITTKASEVGTKLDGIKVPEAQGVPGAGGKAPVEAPGGDHPAVHQHPAPATHDSPATGDRPPAHGGDSQTHTPADHDGHAPSDAHHGPAPDPRPADTAPPPLPPDSPLFDGYQPADLAPDFVDADGNIIYPDSSLPEKPYAIPGTIVPDAHVPAGTMLDRFGYPGGEWLSPHGTPFAERALPPDSALKPYFEYVVKDPTRLPPGWRIEESAVAPWFHQPGGGLQYRIIAPDGTDASVTDLVGFGVLERVEK